MDFTLYISTPVGKTQAAPKTTSFPLTQGRLTGGLLFFPPGPAGTLHLIAKIGEHQIIPFNTGQNYRLDNCTIPLNIDIDLTQPPYTLDVITWNDSTSYAHALTLTLFLDPFKPARKRRGFVHNIINQVTGYHKR